MNKIAVVGAGIIGMTNAIVLLENGFDVTVFTKDDPLATNSDAAVATWFAPNDDKPLLQKYCLDSLPIFAELIKKNTPGVNKISELLYFKTESDYKNSVWAKASVKKWVELLENFDSQTKINGYEYCVLANIPLINPNLYRPYMLKKFESSHGKLIIKEITSLNDLTKEYSIVVNSSGWEAKHLTPDASVYPVRGQTETFVMSRDIKRGHSLNVEGMTAYVVFRPAEQGNADCVLGTTYQVDDKDRKIRTDDTRAIIKKVSTFFSDAKDKTTVTKVGIRCGRKDALVKIVIVNENSALVHCYGHGGSGYSASWASANEVLTYCKDFVNDKTPQFRPKI